jgi:23S rRNA pseudouridine1911/1915/1917 synthase
MPTRKYRVRRPEGGTPLADWLSRRLALSSRHAHELLRAGDVRIDGRECHDPLLTLRPEQVVAVRLPRCEPTPPADLPEDLPAPILRHVDDHIVVVEKPAGLTTMRHPGEVREFGQRDRRFLPPTLAGRIPSLLPTGRSGRPVPVRAVHRLDKETSGLLVFARTRNAERHLARQFREHTTERLYLALTRGRARPGRIESNLVRDRGDGRRGSTTRPGEGQRAVTHVRVLEHLGDYSYVECRLETGRTHQVRIHLGEAGTPLCGERIYDRPLHGSPVPDDTGLDRIALHAATLAFDHPATGERLRFTSPLPADLADLLARLRERANP